MFNTINGTELDQLLIQNSEGLIVVCFSADYLGESRMLDSILQEIASDYSSVIFVRIDGDADSHYAAQKGVYHLPTVMIYNASELVHFKQGLQGKAALKRTLSAIISNEQTA